MRREEGKRMEVRKEAGGCGDGDGINRGQTPRKKPLLRSALFVSIYFSAFSHFPLA
jgi:hypothetical protein